ncbi:MAG: type III-B CRISPR module-associated protein Cmr5 [Bacteroidales bacterium]|nr:type III-B CRISPR module-associated protein Cmr5 [Bacteroidales bacterium]
MALPKTLEQGRASYAYDCARKGVALNSSEYKSYTKKIPMLIKTNGLGATFAFIKSKGGKTYNLIHEQTFEWLSENKLFEFEKSEDFVKDIISLKSDKYRSATIEVLALFTWLRRFAEGLDNS